MMAVLLLINNNEQIIALYADLLITHIEFHAFVKPQRTSSNRPQTIECL